MTWNYFRDPISPSPSGLCSDTMERCGVKLSRRVGKVLEVYGVLGTHIKVLERLRLG